MKKSAKKDVKKTPVLQAGVAGASGGTLVLLIADTIPDTNSFKPIIQYIAPSLSVALSAAWIWVKSITTEYYNKKRNNSAIKELNEKLETFLSNPHTSEEHKDYLRAKLEELEKEIVSNQLEGVKILSDAIFEEKDHNKH